MLNKTGRYVMYLRKSRQDAELENQTDEETLARHERLLRDCAKRYGIPIAATYREVKSGESIAARPQMQRLLSEVSDGLWDGILVVEIERLARGDSIDQGLVSRALQESGTLVITPGKIYDPNNEMDEEYFEFSLFMSRREYKTIKRRMNRGRIAASKEGKYCGNRPPYGYGREKIQGGKGYKLIPNEAEAPIVQQIYDWYANGIPLPDGSRQPAGTTLIAAELNARGIPPRYAAQWGFNSVSDILKNPVYIGKILWQKNRQLHSVNPDGTLRLRQGHEDASQVIIADGLHEPLIPYDLYDAVQKKLDSYRQKHHIRIRSSAQTTNALSGLIRCQECGRNLFFRKAGARSPHDTMLCNTKGCSNIGCYYDALEHKVVNGLKSWAKDKNLFLNTTQSKSLTAQLSSLRKKIKTLEQEEQTLAAQLERIFDSYERGIYDDETFLTRSASVKSKREETKQELKRLHENRKELNRMKLEQQQLIPKVRSLAESYWDIEDPAQRNRLLKEVVDHIDYLKTEKSSRNGAHDNFEITLYPNIKTDFNFN